MASVYLQVNAGLLLESLRLGEVKYLSPGEIEEVLLEHEAVADCAVIGVPSDQWGEAVAAVIVLHEKRTAGADELRAWVQERLRSSRAPERIEFWRELPDNETGKLLRRELRAALAGEAS